MITNHLFFILLLRSRCNCRVICALFNPSTSAYIIIDDIALIGRLPNTRIIQLFKLALYERNDLAPVRCGDNIPAWRSLFSLRCSDPWAAKQIISIDISQVLQSKIDIFSTPIFHFLCFTRNNIKIALQNFIFRNS